MNKVLHYNLLPQGAEKALGEEKLSLFHDFMTGKRMDMALLI